ncbi:hypothetical protein BDZ97DRAFT_1906313 [Flammula alnicola]|nr:hypothetical protein BDZ97DRAFT_1906313 [Flammula alnicola]
MDAQSPPFDIYAASSASLRTRRSISTPLAAILALTELIENSDAGTMFELVKALNDGAEDLKKQTSNPISLNAGCELFIAFVTLFPHDSAILTHSYSRVVMQTLLLAHKRKRISVFVTEARPRGLGIKTAEALTAAGVPSTVILDSAVAYVMDKVDFVLVGSEAVVESGGLVNAVGSNQIAIIARAANKPFYALAESYKFHRLFPLSQYDLPSHNSKILSFPRPLLADRSSPINTSLHNSTSSTNESSIPTKDKPDLVPPRITQEQISQNNPDVDYTRPDLISLVFSDVGSLTPEGVSQYLVGMFAG